MLVTIPAITIETQLPVYGNMIAHFGPWGIGGLAVMIPIGTIITTLAVRADTNDDALLRRGAAIALISGAVITPAFVIWSDGPAMWIAFLGCGVAFGCTVPTNIVAGRRIPNDIRASAFGFLQGMILAGFGVGSFVGGALADRLGVREALA